ncbi:MAG: hypothetical protein EPN85_03225 [Bacteroidetes bacterium]|nr:MAG: hypothetical protein EPN85_03225 [Bacteroidota bacterium]
MEKKVHEEVNKFISEFSILEKDTVHVLTDLRTNAFFCECYISAKELIENSTIDVPLDPENQPEYRANRDAQPEHSAYQKMLDDAKSKRMFSNIVCEYNTNYQANKPIKIIGGQHRFLAIESAHSSGINEYHGIKIYFSLDKHQRLDVQLISNTNISVSTDLLDRMFETSKGPELRTWSQAVGLLDKGEDFSDKKQRGSQISVRGARTFILNYYEGKNIEDKLFDKKDTTPVLARTGMIDESWEKLRSNKDVWIDKELVEAGKQFSKLHKAQKDYFKKNKKEQVEFSEKAISYSVLASWAYVSGVLHNNKVRLSRHFQLADIKNTDPLSTTLLAKARHKTDAENYRGLGTRTEPKDRGRLTELFFLHAEKGGGFNKPMVDLAIKKYHAKQSNLEVLEAEKKLGDE